MSLSAKIYSRLPVTLQNAAFSAYGYHLRRMRYGKKFWDTLRWLKESEWWRAEQIEAWQRTKLQDILWHAYTTVPYYRDVFERLGITPADIRDVKDLAVLPILDKDTVKEQWQQLLSTAYRRQFLVKARTGGTTGKPLTVYLTRDALQTQWAVWWRHRARFGLRPNDRYLMVGARLPLQSSALSPPYWRNDWALHRSYLSSYHLTDDTLNDVIDWLDGQRFDFYTGYPSGLYVIAQHLLSRNRKLRSRPRYVVTGSDALLPRFEEAIQEAFGAPVTEQYGMAEACGNLSKCEEGRFHLDFEFGVIEMLSSPGSVPGAERQYRLVFTGFANRAMPLIRYDIGDIGTYDGRTCSCGRESLSLQSIDGRIEDYIRTPDGRKVIGLNQVFEWAQGVKEVQVVQEKLSEIELRIVRGPGFSEADKKVLLEHLRPRVGPELRVKFVLVDSIPRTANGKFRAVICRLPSEDAGEVQLKAAQGV